MDPQIRSTTFELSSPDDKLQLIRVSIRKYRAALRKMYAAFTMAQMCGQQIQMKDEELRIKPDNEAASVILAKAFGKEGKALGYSMRDWFLKDLYPGAMSFVWDSARRDLDTRWKSKDPEFPSVGRGWLTLQGARALAQFNGIGIGFPRATAAPKLEGHTLTLKWDHTIGPVEFNLGRLERDGLFRVWKNLRNETPGWKLGTIFLNERDGKIIATISYEIPVVARVPDLNRELRVVFGGDAEKTIFKLVGPDGEGTFDTIGGEEALAWLNKQRIHRNDLEGRRASAGSKRRPWGQRKAFEHAQRILSNLTIERERRQKDTNHAWTRRVVSRAIQWNCGKIVLQELPEKDIHSHPWSWYEFKEFLKYKCSEQAIALFNGETLVK